MSTLLASDIKYDNDAFVSGKSYPDWEAPSTEVSSSLVDNPRNSMGEFLSYDSATLLFNKMPSTTSDYYLVDRFISWVLKQGVLIVDKNAVRDYLLFHLDIIESVNVGVNQAKTIDTDDLQLELAIYIDPEDSCSQLTLYLRQVNYLENIIEEIDKIFNEVSERLMRTSCWFHITTDFQPPKSILVDGDGI